MTSKHLRLQVGAALAPLLLAAAAASAAEPLLNVSLTSFTGNSTQAATQAAIAGAKLNFTSTAGAGEDPPGTSVDPTITFDSSGANFGTFLPLDGGRNYIRTLAADYANYSFVAEVTWVTADMFSQAAYFGLGSADHGTFRIADWETPGAAVQLFMEVDPLDPTVNILKNRDSTVSFDAGTDAPGLDTGTNRLRLTYDWFQKTAVFAIDFNYAGGAFTADVTIPTVKTLDLYGAGGWSAAPARVYFGGDDGTVFKDFTATLSTPTSTVLGDFNSSGTITAADWIILRNNLHSDFSAMTFSQAYHLGDVSADKITSFEDFALFKGLYDAANGAGSFVAMLASVPEPSSSAALLSALAWAFSAARRARRHG